MPRLAHLSGSSLAVLLVVQLLVWAACLVIGAAIADGPGVLLGHIVGCILAASGVPARWLIGDGE